MTDEERVRHHLAKMCNAAHEKYSRLCDDVLHDDAMLTRYGRLSPSKQSRLATDALALCGDPYCRFSRNIWSGSAWKFFRQFTEGEA